APGGEVGGGLDRVIDRLVDREELLPESVGQVHPGIARRPDRAFPRVTMAEVIMPDRLRRRRTDSHEQLLARRKTGPGEKEADAQAQPEKTRRKHRPARPAS